MNTLAHPNTNQPAAGKPQHLSAGVFDCHPALAQKERRAGQPVFDAVIELDTVGRGGGGERGGELRWTVVKDVGGVVDKLLSAGAVFRPEVRATMPPNLAENDAFDGHDDDGEDEHHGVGGAREVREMAGEGTGLS